MGYITARDATRIAYDSRGTGRPVVFLHGWAMAASVFTPQLAALSPRARAIAPDLRGHGRSGSGPSGRPTIADLADDVADLLAALDVENAVLVGWSMGAAVLWSYLARHGEARVAGLVFEDMSPRILNDDAWSLGLKDGHRAADTDRTIAAMTANWGAFAGVFVPRMFAEGLQRERREEVETILDLVAYCDVAAMASLWASLAEFDARKTLARITAPTLVVNGALSQLYASATADHVVSAIANAKRVEFQRSGHAPHLEEPERFNLVIEGFLDTLEEEGTRGPATPARHTP